MLANNKSDKLLILKMIISSIVIASFYVIFYKNNSDFSLMDFINKIPFSSESIFWGILIIFGAVLFLYNIWDVFVKKKGHKYCKFLEIGIIGVKFENLTDEEKEKTIKNSKRILVLGLLFIVIFFFLFNKFLNSYIN